MQVNPKLLSAVGIHPPLKQPMSHKGKLSQQQHQNSSKKFRMMIGKVSDDKSESFNDDDARTLSTYTSSTNHVESNSFVDSSSPETDEQQQIVITSGLRYNGLKTSSDICQPLIDSHSSSITSSRSSTDRSSRGVKKQHPKIPPLDFDKLKSPTGTKKLKQQTTVVATKQQGSHSKKSLSPASSHKKLASPKSAIRNNNNGFGCMCTIC